MADKRGFGDIERSPADGSGPATRGPDLRRHSAPITFDTKLDAEAWLVDERRLIVAGGLDCPRTSVASLSRPRTRRSASTPRPGWPSVRSRSAPTSGTSGSSATTCSRPSARSRCGRSAPEAIRTWHAKYGTSKPTARSQAYSLLRTILGTAVTDGQLAANPCHIRGAGNVKRVHKVEPATLKELDVMTAAMPPRYRLMLLLAAWCAMRFGELTELRRKDIDVVNGVVRIRRAVVRVRGEFIVGTPKTDAGTRDVAIPPHLMPTVRQHLADHVERGRDALLFPAKQGEHMAPATLCKVWYPARAAAEPPRPPLARPPPHRRRPRGTDRRHARRADGPPRPHHAWRRASLPARRPGPRRRDRPPPVGARRESGARPDGSVVVTPAPRGVLGLARSTTVGSGAARPPIAAPIPRRPRGPRGVPGAPAGRRPTTH